MRVAYLECFSGISGDMFLGALVDAGVSSQLLEETVSALEIGARLEVSQVIRGGVAATKVDVWVDGEKDLPREEYWEQQHSHAEAHAHGKSHSHKHDQPQHSEQGHHSHSHGRGLTEIRRVISAARRSSPGGTGNRGTRTAT